MQAQTAPRPATRPHLEPHEPHALLVVGEEEEVLQLWPANYGCANKHNQWVVYDGKTGDELAAEANRDVVDLTLEEKMDDARRVAEALCAPATLA